MSDELAAADQLALLRRYEPILRFTQGERFYPMSAEHYIAHCSLCAASRFVKDEVLIPRGELAPDQLSNIQPPEPDAVVYLKFAEPLAPRAIKALRKPLLQLRDVTQLDARLEELLARLPRTGILGYLADRIHSLSRRFRGHVPDGTAEAANQAYNRILAEDDEFYYYGRVAEDPPYTVLQYWFLYAMNDWRSGYDGTNEHEADWENVCIFLAEDENGEPRPEWTAYAAHTFDGAKLRRAWDSPDLEKEGDHPVVYVAAGSHASYYQLGRYPVELAFSLLSWAQRLVDQVKRFWWRVILHRRESERQRRGMVTLPLIDYAQGDGLSIGPGQAHTWRAQLFTEDNLPQWLTEYRGLWGFYARDPAGGENGPPGPRFTTEGSLRPSWHDPAGWAGLDQVVTRTQARRILAAEIQSARQHRTELERELDEVQQALTHALVRAEAFQGQPHLESPRAKIREEIKELVTRRKQLQTALAENTLLLEAFEKFELRLTGPLHRSLS